MSAESQSDAEDKLRAAWRRIVHTQLKYIEANIDYEKNLEKCREDFQRKWSNLRPSPDTGLLGFIELATLGCGSFGCVSLVQDIKTGELFATKILSKHKLVIRRQVQNAFYEKRVLHSICFPNHTSLVFSRKDNDNIYLGMTLVRGGDLFTYHRSCKCFDEKQAVFYAAQVFLALEYLHFMQLIYRDLKPENICMDLNGYIKLTDYGFTKYVPNRTLTLCGTPEYLAPEIIKMRPYGASVDWWAFGILIYELVAGSSPFSNFAKDPIVMYDKISEGKFKIPSKFSSPLKSLTNRLLQTEPSKRLGVYGEGTQNIRKHQWFHKIDWYGILNQVVLPPYIPDQSDKQRPKRSSKLNTKSESIQFEEAFRQF